MSYENITYDVSAGVATLTLNRPKVLNALAAPILREISQAVDRTRDEGAARVLRAVDDFAEFRWALAQLPESGIAEAELNPLIIGKKGEGVVAVDALIVPR